VAGTSRWVITTSGDRDLTEIAEELATRGFTTDQALGEIGVLVGSAPSDVLDDLRSVPGVADISQDKQIDIGPPDSPVTW
jgi:hypothetical protein